MSLRINPADFSDPLLRAFLQAHVDDLAPTAPAESRHALDLAGLRAPGVRLWTAHDRDDLAGTVALAPVADGHEEVKSMRTAPERRGRGVAAALLQHALADARARGISRVSLETGSMEFFAPARSFYRKHGFHDCEPFGPYKPDPNSAFMTLSLEGPSPVGSNA
ncbi:MAG: GNAT family N-acetyltransferase [Segniliparus sp.]|uniref:GNAT family N-acetyltransferase n=1 Tax=Segniliparus sp. TaxID=2804064 RepID=UPI003F2D153C